LQWTQDLDIETLEARGHRVTIEELLGVIKFHLLCHENIVKASRPMTYQYLTVDMIATVREKGGFIDQKTFKTAGKYRFDMT